MHVINLKLLFVTFKEYELFLPIHFEPVQI